MKGIFTETIIEFFDRKQHWLYLIVTVLATTVMFYAVSEKIELVKNDIGTQVSLIQSASNSLSNFMTFLAMLSIVSTIFLTPRITRKGQIEFYLSKPITRSTLFYGKMISLSMIYGTTILLCGGVAAGVVSFLGVLSFTSAMYILAIGLVSFLVWFVLISFVGFQLHSAPMCLTVFGGLWGIQLFLKHRTEWGIENSIVQLALDALYHVLPKTSEMSALSVQIATGTETVSFLPVFTSLVLAGILFYTAHSVFSRRDF